MTVLSAVKSSLLRVDDDVTRLLGDLAIFLGYFAVSFYAGGYAYLRAYRTSFRIWSPDDHEAINLLLVFIDKVLATNFYWLVLPAAAVVVSIYALAKFVLKTWAGFLLTSLAMLTSLIAFVAIGEKAGREDATADMLTTSTLPQVSIRYDGDAPVDLGQAGIRLLDEDELFLYIFEDQGELIDGRTGQIRVYAIRKEGVEGYEII